MDFPQIPGYDILAPLPQGGMSAVFKARQISLDRVVVLKILPPAMVGSGVDVEKLLAEAKLTAQLKHPNIVQVYDFGRSPSGVYYFVMEFISGYSVAQWIMRKQNLPANDALVCAHYVGEALSYAWKTFGIVHCDIKPDNIMIDGDGTVKVADLGLAHSVRAVVDAAKLEADFVAGTPYYIAPEQAQGLLDIDCRADIYSLGATLYHCLTGKMPFAGRPLLGVMDDQITGQIPDLMDCQPNVSMAVACLIEKMMAKKPDQRQQDWSAAITDMARARAGLLPVGSLPLEGASTMRRCVVRGQYLKELNATMPAVPVMQPASWWTRIIARFRQWGPSKRLVVVIVTIGLILTGLLLVNELVKTKFAMVSPAGRVGAVLPPSKAPKARGGTIKTAATFQAGALPAPDLAQTDAFARNQLEAAVQWYRTNFGQYRAAIEQFERVAANATGTRYAQAAEKEIERVRAEQRAAMAADMQAWQNKVQPLLDRQAWREAVKLFEQYDGPFKNENFAARKAKITEWLERDVARVRDLAQAAAARQQEQVRQWQALLDTIAEYLLAGNPVAALTAVRQTNADVVPEAHRADLVTLADMLMEAERVDQRLLNSFRAQKNKEIVVALNKGAERLVITDVRSNSILAKKIIVVKAGQLVQSRVIRLQDLSANEKKCRLGTNAAPQTALVHGLVDIRDGNLTAAETAWRQSGPLFAKPLLAKLQECRGRQKELQARSDFIILLHTAKVNLAEPLPDCATCLAAIHQKKYSKQMAKVLANSVAVYGEKFGQTAFARDYGPALEALKHLPTITAVVNKNAGTASVPAKVVVGPPDGGAVLQKLLDRNPGMVELNISFLTNDAGKIVRAELVSVDLKDISPLAELPDLCSVVCAAINPEDRRVSAMKAPLNDLSPLKGLPLQEICLIDVQVKDLLPLAGLALNKLNLSGLRVVDLTALKNMPLQDLTINRLALKDIKPLAGLPLESLDISHTSVSDLTPLAGMKLKRLIARDSRIRDIAVLAGMPLTELVITRAELVNISPLAGLPLERLELNQTRVQNLAALAGLPLQSLDLRQTNVRDLTPLAGLALRHLNLNQTKIRALTSLRGMALERLHLNDTRVANLDALRDMPLKFLDISNTDVRDLSPLRGMPLQDLMLVNTAIQNLTPIQGLPIERIFLDYNPNQHPQADTYRAFKDVLLRMPMLREVNGDSNFRAKR